MSVGRSYARSLLEAAKESGLQAKDLDLIEAELAAFAQTMGSSKELNEALTSPIVPKLDKAEIAKAVSIKLGFSKLTTQFLTLVSRKGRARALDEIADAFTLNRLESEGATLGMVVSADPLKKEDLEELAASFTKKLGKKVVFKASVEPSLLAGLKVTVSGITYDGSLKAQLQSLRDHLIYGKSGTTH